MSKVIQCVETDCWDRLGNVNEMKPYPARHNELSVDEVCLLWGSRVIITPNLKDKILQQLHECHPGISRMKSLTRSSLWWPGMDAEFENCVNISKIHPWEWTYKPWVRIHIDYAGPCMNKMFLIVIDSHSKWLEVIPALGIDTKWTIQNLQSIFATHGLLEQYVSDNGTPASSIEFENCWQKNANSNIAIPPCIKWNGQKDGASIQKYDEENGRQQRELFRKTTAIFIQLSNNPTNHHRKESRQTTDGEKNYHLP